MQSYVATYPYFKGANDSFGRLRVAQPQTLFNSKQIFDKQPLFWDDQEVSGGSTSSTHSVNTASTTLGVALNTAGKRVRQTFQSWNYQPGKSQEILMTFVLDKSGGGTGITRGVGQFNGSNGIFLKDDEGDYKFVVRSSASGSPVDTEVAQANWNIDQFDGNGPSQITIDFTKSQILIIDYEWLGVGIVRIGFVIDGMICYGHIFKHANVLNQVYMSTPNLPLRYEIENDGTGVASTIETICSSVASEGGTQKLGVYRHADSGSISGLATGTAYALMGIKIKFAYIGADIFMENISAIANTSNEQFYWELRLNPTVAGTFNYSGQTDSAVQIAKGSLSNTVTGGFEIDGGFVSTATPITAAVPNARRLGAAIDGTLDTIVLVGRPITNNITLQASMTWLENQ